MASLKFNGLKEIEKAFKTAGNTIAAAEARAVKRAGVTIAANQSREMAATVNLRIGTIKRELVTKRQPTAAKPAITFEVKERGVPLKEFIGTTQTKKGVAVRVLKKGSRDVLRAAFGAESKGGHFFGRVGKGSKRYGSPHVGRLPIAKLYGPNVLSQFIKEAIQTIGSDTWKSRLPVELERETNFALRKAGLI